jgi:hypothetical protein
MKATKAGISGIILLKIVAKLLIGLFFSAGRVTIVILSSSVAPSFLFCNFDVL